MRAIGCLGLLLVVAGCTPDASSNMTRDVRGTVIGSAEQHDVAAADGQIGLNLPEFPITGRRGRNFPGRYDETILFPGGGMRFQRLDNMASFSGATTNIAAIQDTVDSDGFRQRGLTQPVKNLQRVVNRYGTAQYAIVENAQWRCSAFAEYFWMGGTSWATSPGNAEIRGSLCYQTRDAKAAQLEALTEKILQAVQVGPGANPPTSQEASAALPATSTPPGPTAAVAVSTTARPPLASSDFKVAPVGTRFVTMSGYFQIVRVEGYTVTTVNAANQTGRWLAGLLIPRTGASIDDSRVPSLFPIAVGKEITLDESNSHDGWRYTIKVLRTEPYKIGNHDYETFVIEVRDQSLTPDQGGFDRRRTVWYSPELGGLLRQREVQLGGPSVRLFNWDVVEVVPPKSS